MSAHLDLVRERQRQDAQWGEQDHPDGTHIVFTQLATDYREACNKAASEGSITWTDIFLEEVYEALAEEDPAKLRAELIQTAAVALAWVEAIDRRASGHGA